MGQFMRPRVLTLPDRRRLLLVSTALVGVVAITAPAQAETVVSNKRETPIATSTANNGQPDDIRIDEDGTIELSSGTAITLDSRHKVTNEGRIQIEDADDATGILIRDGQSGAIDSSGQIFVDEDYETEDSDDDEDLDGPFARGSRRFGIRAEGTFTGDIDQSGAIVIEGNDSAGIYLGGKLTGSLDNSGTISVIGDRSVALRTSEVTGKVSLTGNISATGAGSVGVSVDGDIGGLTVQSLVTATGYRYTAESDDRDDLDADDLLQGGAALRVRGSVANGIILDTRPADDDDEDDDEDDDGTDDDEEKNASIISYGAAPAIEIGAADRGITIGKVGSGDLAYGLVSKGGITALGVYDGIAATAVSIGGQRGGTTTIEGGLNFEGTVAADASEASATGVAINSGAFVSEIRVGNSVSASSTSDTNTTARAIAVASGAAVETVRVDGRLSAAFDGDTGSAIALEDRSGAIRAIENTGAIAAVLSDMTAEEARTTGRAIALDLRANTSGVTVRQRGVEDGDDGDDDKTDLDTDGDGIDDNDEPVIQGSVLFGSGNDRLEILNGTVVGNISFGAGADALVVENASVRTVLSDSDGRLDVDLRSGSLELVGTGRANASSLTVGRNAQLILTIDPETGAAGGLDVSGSATFAQGAKVGVRLSGLLRSERTFELVRAGSLSASGVQQDLVGDIPFLYASTLSGNSETGTLSLNLRRKTASELGMNRSEAVAYDAIYEVLSEDDELEKVFLAQTNGDGLRNAFDQMLPEHSGGVFDAVTSGSRAAARAAIEGALRTDEPGRRVWLQEVYYTLDRDRGVSTGYRGQGFGFTGGIEQQREIDAFGLSASFLSSEIRDRDNSTDTTASANQFEAAAYWRANWGGLRADVRAAAGWLMLDGKREFVGDTEDERVTRRAKSSGNGWLVGLRASTGYEVKLGPAYLRPGVAIEYFRLAESDRHEKGGGDAFNLAIDKRTSDELSVTGLLAAGSRFDIGNGQHLAVEIEGGWRKVVGGEVGSTTARFEGGEAFTLRPDPIDQAATGVLRVFGGGAGILIGGEVSGEKKGDRQIIGLRAIARFSF